MSHTDQEICDELSATIEAHVRVGFITLSEVSSVLFHVLHTIVTEKTPHEQLQWLRCAKQIYDDFRRRAIFSKQD